MNRIPVAALAALASLGTASAQSHYAGVFDDICEAGPDGAPVWATSARASTSAFDSGGVTAHDLPSVAILNVLADRLEANDHALLAAQVRQTIPLIHG